MHWVLQRKFISNGALSSARTKSMSNHIAYFIFFYGCFNSGSWIPMMKWMDVLYFTCTSILKFMWISMINVCSANAFPHSRVFKAFTEAIFYDNGITEVPFSFFRHGWSGNDKYRRHTRSRWQHALLSPGTLAPVSAVSHSPPTNMTQTCISSHWSLKSHD